MTPTLALLATTAALQAAVLVCGVLIYRQIKRASAQDGERMGIFLECIERALRLEPGHIAQDVARIRATAPAVVSAPTQTVPTGPDPEVAKREAVLFAANHGLQIPVFAPSSMGQRKVGPLEESPTFGPPLEVR